MDIISSWLLFCTHAHNRLHPLAIWDVASLMLACSQEKRIHIPLPDEEARYQLLTIHLRWVSSD
jgi:hypothetical protein